MSIDAYTISVPVFIRSLEALSGVLDKAAAWASARRADPAVVAATRLVPDMFPLSRQVQTACDFAKNATARLAGIEAPRFEDGETDLEALKARIARTIDFLRTVDPVAVASAPGRTVEFPIGPQKKARMEASDYLVHYALPNFHFHLTTAYAILRGPGSRSASSTISARCPASPSSDQAS